MDTIDITKEEFDSLKQLQLDDSITYTEGRFYFYGDSLLLKKYFNLYFNNYLKNKIYTLEILYKHKKDINIEQLIFPENLISIDGVVSGFTMPYIPNSSNLSTILTDENVSLEFKLKLLKECGEIIESVHNVSCVDNFLLGDIHEDNFIYNYDDKKIYVIDLDGCKINDNDYNSMKFGSCNNNFYKFDKKYKLDKYETPIPSINTEWYCYSMMVLNMLGQGNVHCLLEKDFFEYLKLLKNCGVGDDLISYFYDLYTLKDNISPIHLLDQIPLDINTGKINVKEFARKKRLLYEV